MVYQSLTSDKISLIDVEELSASPHLPRIDCAVDSLTQTGKTCLDRAAHEFERRFMNSESETRLMILWTIFIIDRQLAATLLDVRTKACPPFEGPADAGSEVFGPVLHQVRRALEGL